MPALLECVPNFSEGRDPSVLRALEEASSGVEGARLLDVHRDASHHRSVFTLAGPGPALGEAVFRMVGIAADRIDLTAHRGEHPRIGAADVVPFVPLDRLELGDRRGADMDACVAAARETGERIAGELGIPVFLYGRAAVRSGRSVPASFRRGGFERLREAMGRDPEREPDLGPSRVHPTAGASAVGARDILVAYNVVLDTADPGPAREIAREIRESDGGLPAVQALGFRVEGGAQVSTNLLDVWRTAPLDVFRAVRKRAADRGIDVRKSEIVGLVPRDALPPDPEDALLLEEPAARKVLERRISEEL